MLVLLVDGSSHNRKATEMCLQKAGYSVRVADNVEQVRGYWY